MNEFYWTAFFWVKSKIEYFQQNNSCEDWRPWGKTLKFWVIHKNWKLRGFWTKHCEVSPRYSTPDITKTKASRVKTENYEIIMHLSAVEILSGPRINSWHFLFHCNFRKRRPLGFDPLFVRKADKLGNFLLNTKKRVLTLFTKFLSYINSNFFGQCNGQFLLISTMERNNSALSLHNAHVISR